jgi:hypothetical protein
MRYLILLSLIFLVGCQNAASDEQNDKDALTKVDAQKEGGSDIIMVDGALFSIPSPVEAALFIKNNGSGFREDLLLNPGSTDQYTSSSQKALALGVFGAELGYVSMYEQNDRSISYMGAARKLADDIGMTGAFSENLVRRFSNNIGTPDSLMVLVSEIYKAGDIYLKNNDRNDVAALVLVGGWVESLYITCREAEKGNIAFKKRIAEQKTSLLRLNELLAMYPENAAIQELKPQLDKLMKDYHAVKSDYVFKRPEVINAEQLTILKGGTNHEMDEATLKSIIAHVKELRTAITRN